MIKKLMAILVCIGIVLTAGGPQLSAAPQISWVSDPAKVSSTLRAYFSNPEALSALRPADATRDEMAAVYLLSAGLDRDEALPVIASNLGSVPGLDQEVAVELAEYVSAVRSNPQLHSSVRTAIAPFMPFLENHVGPSDSNESLEAALQTLFFGGRSNKPVGEGVDIEAAGTLNVLPIDPSLKNSAAKLQPPQRQASSPGNLNVEAVRRDETDFLSKIGFQDYSSQIGANLKSKAGSLTPLQQEVLKFNRRRYQVLNAARELAVETMGSLAQQSYSAPAMESAAELAARLIALQPLAPPSVLPPEIAGKSKDDIVDWMVAVTIQKIGQHLTPLISDIVKTVVKPAVLERAFADIRNGRQDGQDSKALIRKVLQIKGWAQTLLVTAYTDAEIGQTRYAGRALGASLVRFSRKENRPEVEGSLRKKLQERGLNLENFVGDTLVLRDASLPEKERRIQVKTGDHLFEYSGGHEAAEIAFAVRPAWPLWFRAFREKLLGNIIAMWANPKSAPRYVPGQNWRNRLKFLIWKFQKWLSGAAIMRRGYSHVGMASVEEADGVSMVWAKDIYPNAGQGGIRQIGIVDQFALNGPFIRFGLARLDPVEVWKSFARSRAEKGYQQGVFQVEGRAYPSLISLSAYEELAAIPKYQSPRLLEEINKRAIEAFDSMMVESGMGFSSDFSNTFGLAYCALGVVLSRLMGSQWDVQSFPDHWSRIVLWMKKMGVEGAKDQKTDGRIIWPASLAIDSNIGLHVNVDFPAFTQAGRVPDPYTIPAYVERDSKLTQNLLALVRLSKEGSIHPDPDTIDEQLRTHLDSRSDKGRAKSGLASGAASGVGYSAGLASLLSASDDN